MKIFISSILMLAICIAGAQFSYAQELPDAGDRTFEVTVAPFDGSPVSFGEFRLRSFQSTDSAFRLRADVDYESRRTGENQRRSRLMLEVAPGIEWHAFQYDRLSVYYGAELGLRYRTSRDQISADITNRNNNPAGFFGVDLNALAGLDLHFLQRLYTGVEVGYGIRFTNYLDQEINDQDVEVNRRDLDIGTFAQPRFRLGFRF